MLKDSLAKINTDISCTGNRFETEPGDMASLGKYINMRFDIYFDVNKAPFYRSDPDYRPAPNVVKGLVLPNNWVPGDRCQYNTTSGDPNGPGSSDWQWPAGRYKGPGHHMNAGFTAVNLNDVNILSTETDAILDALPFQDEDLVRYDPTATVYFDGTAIPLPGVDAVHVLADGHIILSTEDTASLGGLIDFG